MARIGVILSGCGVYDGSEIHEAVITLLCLDQHGASYQCIAPAKTLDVVDHITQKQVEGQTRDVLTESARIARGDIAAIADIQVADYDAFILPGGFGAAKNLCTFASDGPDCQVDQQLEKLLTDANVSGKPLGFVCIAPAIAARVFGQNLKPKLTIGHDNNTASGLEAMGAKHVDCNACDVVIDEKNRIVTTPAYMEAQSIKDVYDGIDKLVTQVLALAQ